MSEPSQTTIRSNQNSWHQQGCSCGCGDKYNRSSPMQTPITQNVQNLIVNGSSVGIFTEQFEMEEGAKKVTLAVPALPFFQPQVWINGILQAYKVHYDIDDAARTITFNTNVTALLDGDLVQVQYMFQN